jgi:hypothetical protein
MTADRPVQPDGGGLDRLFSALGVDAVQWRALTITYIRMDLRVAGGAVRRDGRRPSGASPLAGLLLVSGIGSIAFAIIAASASDALVSASLLAIYGAASTMMLLLVDFTSVVLSPDDYGILGHRPVGSRTYFAARLAAVALYVGAISLAIALLPAIVYAAKVSPLAFPATLLAVVCCDLSTAVLVITGYVVLLRWVHPARLRRAMSYVQLLAATSFYVMYYLATVGFRHVFLGGLGFDTSPWLWAVPPTWFAAFVPIAGGQGTAAAWAASGAAVALTLLCIPLAAGRLSLDYARRVGEMTATSEPAEARRSLRLPGFGRGEARAIALLVRAQFRFDQRFRMGVLSILPLTGFYLLMGLDAGALRDPFVEGERAGGPGVYFAVIFIPMTLHTALTISESWRAAWIFFATPASHARIVVAAKNFVSVYFLGSYICVLVLFWSYFFDRVWHAVVHAAILGLLAHLLLQLTVIAKPALPFAAEPRKGERSSRTFVLFLVGGVVAGIFPLLLPLVYQRPAFTVGLVVFLLMITVAVEYALRLRVAEAIGDLEFQY